MRPFAILLGLVLLAAGPAARADEDDPEPPGGGREFVKLKGKWTVIRVILGGREVNPPRPISYTFESGKVTTEFGTQKRTTRVKLDARKRPATIEFIPQGAAKGQVSIYQIERGELKIASAPAKGEKTTPTSFDGRTGTVLVLTREKK